MTDNPYLYHAEKIVDISQHLFLKEKKPRKLEIDEYVPNLTKRIYRNMQ